MMCVMNDQDIFPNVQKTIVYDGVKKIIFSKYINLFKLS